MGKERRLFGVDHFERGFSSGPGNQLCRFFPGSSNTWHFALPRRRTLAVLVVLQLGAHLRRPSFRSEVFGSLGGLLHPLLQIPAGLRLLL